METFWLALLPKMVLTASIVLIAAYLVERSGPVVGALIATLPVSAGPAYAFLALEHDVSFMRQAYLFSFTLNAASSVFIAIYSNLAGRRGLPASLGCAVAAWISIGTVLGTVAFGFPLALVLNVVLFALGLATTARVRRTAVRVSAAPPRLRDHAVRAALVMALVGAVLAAARILGPGPAGIVAIYPVGLTSLILLLQSRLGGAAMALVIANTLPGMIGVSVALAVLYVGSPVFGVFPTLCLGLLICVAWNMTLLIRARTRRAAALPGRRVDTPDCQR